MYFQMFRCMSELIGCPINDFCVPKSNSNLLDVAQLQTRVSGETRTHYPWADKLTCFQLTHRSNYLFHKFYDIEIVIEKKNIKLICSIRLFSKRTVVILKCEGAIFLKMCSKAGRVCFYTHHQSDRGHWIQTCLYVCILLVLVKF